VIVAVLALLAAVPARAQTEAPPAAATPPAAVPVPAPAGPRPLVLLSDRASAQLAPASEGVAEWLRLRLRQIGVATAPGAEARRDWPLADEKIRSEALLDGAAKAGAPRALLLDVRVRGGEAELLLRLMDVSTRQLLAAGRARGKPAQLGELALSALTELVPTLGSNHPPAQLSIPSLDQLAILSAALRDLDRENFVQAWQRIAPEPPLLELKGQIQAAAKQPGVPHEERVRLLVAMGEADTAWAMIFGRAEQQLGSETPDPKVLLAAGETQLERGDLQDAALYLERAAQLAPDDPAVHDALGRARERKKDVARAGESYRKAIELAPSLERVERLATLERGNPAEAAPLLLQAAQIASAELRPGRAREHFTTARSLAPELASPSLEAEARLAVRVLEFDEANQSVDRAIEVGGKTAQRLKLKGSSARSAGRADEAERAYRGALELAPEDPDTLRELGSLEVESGRVGEARAHLTRAAELAPKSAQALRALAGAERAGGQPAAALDLLRRAEELAPATGEQLLERANVERETGDVKASLLTLQRAEQVEPADPEIYKSLATASRELGDEDAAKRYEGFVLTFGGAHFKRMLGEEEPDAPEISASLETLVESFFRADPAAQRLIVLGVREPAPESRFERWRDWIAPRVPNFRGIARALQSSIGKRIEVVPAPAAGAWDADAIDKLYDFGKDGSLDPKTITTLNSLYESDALLLVRLKRVEGGDPQTPASCGVSDFYLLEARMLLGRVAEDARILANSACLPGGAWEQHGRWNPSAIALYTLLLLLILYPFVRGFGRVTVNFQLPPKTRPFFSVRLSRRRMRVKEGDAPTDDAKWRIREKLQILQRNEKRLIEGTTVDFRRVAARRRPYYITVRGPLVDFHSGDVIGSFNAEKQVLVKRGQPVIVEFDMRPKQACIEVRVTRGGSPVPDARVALRSDAKSVRFTRGRPAFIYLDPGTYVLVAGGEAEVAEMRLVVANREPLQVTFDLWDKNQQVFAECPAAVGQYLEGHFAGAAEALEQAGQRDRARKLRALAQLPANDVTPVRELLLGREQGAASDLKPVRVDEPADDRAPAALEESGQFGRAGHAYRKQGRLADAARAFEAAYEWDNAAECYRELGELPALLEVLERAGHVYEAARIAAQLENWDRAVANLKQVDRRDPNYPLACVMFAQILDARGDADLALEKFDEISGSTSSEVLDLPGRMRYAELLEGARRFDDAVEVYKGVRRIDHENSQARERLDSLRHKLTQMATQIPGSVAPAGGGVPVPSRYEVMGELGRGAMGIVYKARDTVLGRMVALKKLPDGMRDNDLAVKFFLREARSAAALNHPNIVTVFDAGQEGDSYFITMECLEGTPLDAVLKRAGKLSARDTAIVGMQAATGLAYAHSNSIIHRDIKASNLFYTRERAVKIMDFGLAKAVEEVRKQATAIAGTPYYMPPEQAIGGVVDHRSDLYALGVTLFQLCTGQVPFPDGDVTYHHAHTPPPDPRELVPEIPAQLAELILQLLAKRPEDRVQSAEEVARALREVAAGSTPART
jgi:tetratricopeptide (TPR) repeat protein